MTILDMPQRTDAGHDRDEAPYGTCLEQSLPAERDGAAESRDHATPDEGETPGGSAPPEGRAPDHPDDAEDRKPETTAEPGADGEKGKPGQGSPATEDEKKDEPPPPPSKWVFVVVGLVLAGLLGWGAYAQWRRHGAAQSTRQESQDRVPEVRTTIAQREDKPIELTLPGQTEALNTANLYARATGYVTDRRVDIGSRVKKGDLLVHIQAPDLDQQLAQAEAQVGQVKAAEAQAHAQVAQADANVNLAKVTLARTQTLTTQGYDTLQNRDNQTANLLSQQANLETAKAGVKVAEANTKAQLATVDRLRALTGFEDVRAPFDGVVTVRNVDVGDLISADSSSASPMFSMARDDVIRVTLQVPQNQSAGVRDGLPAKIEVPSQPGQIFRGTVTRSSVALLSSARTLDVEVDIPNTDRLLRPGLFAYVTVDIPRARAYVMVPGEALIFNQHGMQVAVADGDKAVLHDVNIYRDLGTTVELSEGLDGGEQVILSPPAILSSDARIKARRAEDQRPEGGDQPDQTKKGDVPGGEHKS